MTEPARKIKRSAVKNIVRFPAIKANMGKTILVESILESNYCLHLEFSKHVKSYKPQPKTFHLADQDGTITFTPDFEVELASGEHRYDEVKPSQISESDYYRRVFSCFEESIKDKNLSFQVVTEHDICREPLLSNYQKLYRYRKKSSFLDIRKVHDCALRLKGQMRLSRLITDLKGIASLSEIYSWLAWGYIRFDIENKPLSSTTLVHFYVN